MTSWISCKQCTRWKHLSQRFHMAALRGQQHAKHLPDVWGTWACATWAASRFTCDGFSTILRCANGKLKLHSCALVTHGRPCRVIYCLAHTVWSPRRELHHCVWGLTPGWEGYLNFDTPQIYHPLQWPYDTTEAPGISIPCNKIAATVAFSNFFPLSVSSINNRQKCV